MADTVAVVSSHEASSHNNSHNSSSTYEATRAQQSTWGQPDKIHWIQSEAYRQNPYRQLHHQHGLIGNFTVRLLEASNLRRSYWSALALGPVKHLGLSKAHGPVSSYCLLQLTTSSDHNNNSVIHKSPVVSQNDNPIWNTSCSYTLPLKKGFGKTDGVRVFLHVEVVEDATAAEQVVLLSDNDRSLGNGYLDVTSLLLGHDVHTGKATSGIVDAWIPISKQRNQQRQQQQQRQDTEEDDYDSTTTTTGKVRVLVSYERHGLEPRPNDLVALEAFARRSVWRSSCPPILSPLWPLKVLDVRQDHVLCEYVMQYNNSTTSSSTSSSSSGRTRRSNDGNNNNKATIRLHRNAIFVIERTNLVDGAVNFALAPSDFFFSTPVGRTTAHVTQPLVQAMSELFQPAWLTTRVMWAAIRTTTVASMTGVQAATHAVWDQSMNAAERRDFVASLQQHQGSSQHQGGRGRDDGPAGGGGNDDHDKSSQHLFV